MADRSVFLVFDSMYTFLFHHENRSKENVLFISDINIRALWVERLKTTVVKVIFENGCVQTTTDSMHFIYSQKYGSKLKYLVDHLNNIFLVLFKITKS